jgi:hypothetical protein
MTIEQLESITIVIKRMSMEPYNGQGKQLKLGTSTSITALLVSCGFLKRIKSFYVALKSLIVSIDLSQRQGSSIARCTISIYCSTAPLHWQWQLQDIPRLHSTLLTLTKPRRQKPK